MIKICKIILSYLEENQKPIYPATHIFWHQPSHKYQEPEILHTIRLDYF